MKITASIFFLSSGFFALMMIFGEFSGRTQNIIPLAAASFAFGAILTAGGSYYRKRNTIS